MLAQNKQINKSFKKAECESLSLTSETAFDKMSPQSSILIISHYAHQYMEKQY